MMTATAVRERPILFSGPMVRAILDGCKTQTRRVVTGATSLGNCRPSQCDLASDLVFVDPGPSPAGNRGPYLHAPVVREHGGADIRNLGIIDRIYPRWVPGDLLWVREAWQYADWTEDGYPFIGYQADGARICQENYPEEWANRVNDTWAELSDQANYDIDGRAADRRWRSLRFMPRWASRLTLRVTDVRVERVQAISEADAIAEGVESHDDDGATYYGPYGRGHASAVFEFHRRWDTLNAKRGYGWSVNPFVWVISFEAVK